MPGNVPAVALANLAVMPLSLSTAFEVVSEFAALENEYADGSSQRRLLVSNGGDRTNVLPRLRWRLSKRLTPARLTELREFYDARNGGAEAFIFYDPYGGVGIGNHDPLGVDSDGRYIVRFASDWRQSLTVGRGNVAVELVELPLAYGSGTLDFSDPEESGALVFVGV
jgi:hypothetical protein